MYTDILHDISDVFLQQDLRYWSPNRANERCRKEEIPDIQAWRNSAVDTGADGCFLFFLPMARTCEIMATSQVDLEFLTAIRIYDLVLSAR